MTKKICVIGLGYIGFPTSLVFARAGFEVIGVDVSERVVSALNAGEVHIEENGLEEIFQDVRTNYAFKAQRHPEPADTYIIAVPTPVNADHTANVDYVVSATEAVLPYLRKGNTVIVESTIPPRTIDDVVAPVLTKAGWRVGEEIYLAHCPERVLPGRIFQELVENNRIVGGYNPQSAEKAAEVYRAFVKGEIILTSATSAEMAKLMENTFRDVNIALANELAKVSASIGVDALEVIGLANKHPRVNLHTPGPGVGGHCIAVDPYFIIEKAPELTPLMTASRAINNSMPAFVVEQTGKITPFHAGKRVAVFGITYKGNVDDIRESPALEVVHMLGENGFDVRVHDPHVLAELAPFPMFTAEEAVADAECLLILTDHNEFKALDLSLLSRMKSPVILDTKNCVESSHVPQSAGKLYNYGNLHELSRVDTVAVPVSQLA
ncbi:MULTISPECIES: nucleotide sugar dehydrogenase [unclassified Paenibacillus]|uniref:nucleotide sugar dehydrogenase n=1 Tax=unclassified Paenibacillus TaxID=185978 RepID=UPI00020D71DD|nr:MULTISPECIES: nucleotide sugar dehydrogenase [unclassified Paenibacillus]EGL19357.1 nucleotide sugar dehydrogenase [Paenibacillus sp. HGF7]EPD82535.1 nucleotide sugar dehydrogenase [Paenibacillus sp. HGH0039]